VRRLLAKADPVLIQMWYGSEWLSKFKGDFLVQRYI